MKPSPPVPCATTWRSRAAVWVCLVAVGAVAAIVAATLRGGLPAAWGWLLGAATGIGLPALAFRLNAAEHEAARRRLEQQHAELEASEERLRLLAHVEREGVLIHEQGRILDVNEALARMLGCAADALRGRSVLELVAPAHRSRVRTHIASGDENPYEIEVERPAGGTCTVELQVREVVHAGRSLRVVTVRGGAERSRAERELRERDALQRLVLHNIGEIVYLTEFDADMQHRRIRFVSEAIDEILGHGAREVQENPSLWFEGVHPEDVERVQESARRVVEEGTLEICTFRFRHGRSGEYRWLQDRALPYRDPAGRVIGILGIASDVTRLRQAEARMQAQRQIFEVVFSEAPIGMATVTRDGRIRRANRELARILDRPVEALRGLALSTVSCSEDLVQVDELVAALAQGEVDSFSEEVRVARRDGRRLDVLCCGAVLGGRPSEDDGTLILQLVDISKRKLAERRIQGMANERRELERRHRMDIVRVQDRERTHLARELHDDIGQVLAGLRLLLAARTDANLEREVELVRHVAESVSKLSHRLVPPELRKSGVVAAIQQNLCTDAQPDVVPSVALTVNGEEPPLPLWFATHVFRIVQQAVTNACEHAAAQRVGIHLDWQTGRIFARIDDDGRGLGDSEPGFGLLSIRDRAEMIRGSVLWAANETGGTSVQLLAPVPAPDTTAEEWEDPAQVHAMPLEAPQQTATPITEEVGEP